MVTDMQESAARSGRVTAEPASGPSKSSTCRIPCDLRPAALDIPEHHRLADSDRPAAMSIQSMMQGWTEEWPQDQPTSLPSLPVPPLYDFEAILKLQYKRALCLDALDCMTALQAQTSCHRPPTLEAPCIASYSQTEAIIMTGLLSLGTQCCLHCLSTTTMDMSLPSSSFEKRIVMPTLVLDGTSIRSLPIPSVPTASSNRFDMTYVLQLADKESPQASVSLYNTLMTSSVTLRDKLERCLPEPPVQVTSQRLRLLQVVINRGVSLADTDTTGIQQDGARKEGQVPLLTGITSSLVPLPDNLTLPAVSNRPCAGLGQGVEASHARKLPAPTMSSELSFYIRTRQRLPCDLNCEILKHCIEDQKGVELHLIRPSDSLFQILDAMKEDYTRIEGIWGWQEGSSHHFGLDAQGTAALRAKIEGMAQGVAKTQVPALRSLVAMHTLRQAARALADYGIRVAHLYLEQALQRMTFLEAAATRCRTRLTLAFEEVESGLLEDHPKLAVLMQTLRSPLELQGRAGNTLATLIISEQRGFFTLFRPLLSLGLRPYQVDKEGSLLHNEAFDKAMANSLNDMIEQILTVADCLLLPETYITESFQWQCFSTVVLYASEASKEVLEAVKQTQCTVHHFKMEIESSKLLINCDGTERLTPGLHEPPLITNGNTSQQLKKESCWNAPMLCPTSKQAGYHCDMILVVNISRTGSQSGTRTGRWHLRDHLLRWEADNVQVIERELLLPLDIILSPTAAFALYTEEKLELDVRRLAKSSTNYVDIIVDGHLRAISCAHDLVILVFEGGWQFTSRMLHVLDDLYAAALGLDIQLQCFLSDTEEQTGELLTECIKAVRLSLASSYPAMSESPTLAEGFLNRFPALNTLSGHCVLSAGIPLPVFMCLSPAQQAAAVSQFKVSKRVLELYRMQCQQIVDVGSSSVQWDAKGITYGQGHVPGGRELVSNTRPEVHWRRPEEGFQEQYSCDGSSVHRLNRRSSGALEKVINRERVPCPQSYTRDELEDKDTAMYTSPESFDTDTGLEREQTQDMSVKGALRQWLASRKQGLQQTRIRKDRLMSKVQPTNVEVTMAPSRRRWLEEECHAGAVQDPFFDQTADDGHDSTFSPSENSRSSPLDSLDVTSVDNALKSWIAARRTNCKVQKQVSKRPRHSAIPALQRRVQQRLEKSAAKSGLAAVDIYQLRAERSSENGRQLKLPEFEQWRHNALHTVWEDSTSKITQQRCSRSSSTSSDCGQDLQSWTPLDKRAKQELRYDRRGKKGQQSKLVWTEPQYTPQHPLAELNFDLGFP
eukprot:SM000159S01782  [mRNA]  locus=s159:318383:322944:+ [translate_table: standard]